MDGISGFGTLVKMGDGAGPEVFTTIAEVKDDIVGPGMTAETIEGTHHTSPGGWKEWAAGMLDAGEVTFSVNFLPGNATHDGSTGLISRLLARQKTNFKLVWPFTPAEAVGFPALVTGVEPTAPDDDMLSADITLKVTGPPDFTVAP